MGASLILYNKGFCNVVIYNLVMWLFIQGVPDKSGDFTVPQNSGELENRRKKWRIFPENSNK